MDKTLLELGVFLAGASSGALLKYLQDRRMLQSYSELVGQLSRELQQQVAGMSEMGGEAQAKLSGAEGDERGNRRLAARACAFSGSSAPQRNA